MRALATDVAIVAGLLEHPANSAVELARIILEALYANDSEQSIAARRGIVAVGIPGGPSWAIGPYATVNAAFKAVELGEIPLLGVEKVVVLNMRHPMRRREK